MKFRQRSNFSQCDICQELKEQLPGLVFTFLSCHCLNQHVLDDRQTLLSHKNRFQDKSLPIDIRLGSLKLYRSHLIDQYADRCSLWSLKDISMEQMSKLAVCITDGADQVLLCIFFRKIFILCLKCLVVSTLAMFSWIGHIQGQVHGPQRPHTTGLLPLLQVCQAEA